MDETKAYFDSVAPGYARRSQSRLWKRQRQKEVAAIKRLMGGEKLGDVLELACGSGYYTRLLSDQGCKKLVAVDFSPTMLQQCRVDGCVKIVANIEEFVSEDRFDLVLCAGALEFLQHPEVVFRNASQMLRANGALVALMPRVSLAGRLYEFFHWCHNVPVRLFGLRDIQQWAHMAGLKLIDWENVGLFSMTVKLIKLESRQ